MNKMQILGIGSDEYEVMDSKARPVKTIAEMKLIDNLEIGNIIRTIGYYTENDGGGAIYLIRAKTDNDIEDRGLIHFINDTLVAEMVVKDNKINIKQFGAKNDNSEDISLILNNIVTNTTVTEVFFEKGQYLITNTINLPRRILLDFNDSSVEFTGTGYCFNISTRYTEKAVIKNVNLTGTFENGFINASRGANVWGVSFNLYGSRILKFANIINAENIFNSICEDVIFQSRGIFTYNAYDMSNANRFVNCYFLNFDGNVEEHYPDYKFIFTNVKNMLFIGCSFEQYKTLINNTGCAKINFINCETEQQTGAIAKNSTGIIVDNDFMLIGLPKVFESDNLKYEPTKTLTGGQYTVNGIHDSNLRSQILNNPAQNNVKKYIQNENGSINLYDLRDNEWQIRIPINIIQSTVKDASELTQSMSIPNEWQNHESTLYTVTLIVLASDDSRHIYESKFIEFNSESYLDLGRNLLRQVHWDGCEIDGLEVTETMNLTNYNVTLNKTVKQCTAIIKYEKLGKKIW